MSTPRLLINDFVAREESHHFARLELGEVHPAGLHAHDFPELFWVEEGRGIHLVRGERRMLRPSALIFVLPQDVHTVGAASPGDRLFICNLAFRPSLWRDLRRRHRAAVGDWFRAGEPSRREKFVNAAALDFLRHAGLELAGAPRTSLLLERFFLNLAFVLAGPGDNPNELPAWLRDAAERIEREKLFRSGDRTIVARVAGRSTAHVAREVRRFLGQTPTDLVNAIRMRHAAQLLSGTRREILDICGDCGLDNVSHFYTLFRAHHGMTPLAYRRRSRLIVRPGAELLRRQVKRPSDGPDRCHAQR